MEQRLDRATKSTKSTKRPFVRLVAKTGNTGDAVFRVLILFVALLMVGVVVAMVVTLAADAMPSIRQFGFGFLKGQACNPRKGEFGALPFIYGTVASSFLAHLISVPLSLGIALFLVEQAPHYIARPVGFLVELLEAIPS